MLRCNFKKHFTCIDDIKNWLNFWGGGSNGFRNLGKKAGLASLQVRSAKGRVVFEKTDHTIRIIQKTFCLCYQSSRLSSILFFCKRFQNFQNIWNIQNFSHIDTAYGMQYQYIVYIFGGINTDIYLKYIAIFGIQT